MRFYKLNLVYLNNKYFLFGNFVCFSVMAIGLYSIKFISGELSGLIVGFIISFGVTMILFNWNSDKYIYIIQRKIIILFAICIGLLFLSFYYFIFFWSELNNLFEQMDLYNYSGNDINNTIKLSDNQTILNTENVNTDNTIKETNKLGISSKETDSNIKPIISEGEDSYVISKEFVDKSLNLIRDGMKTGIETIAPNMGAGAAGGAAAAAVIKSLNLPVSQKIGVAAAAAGLVAGSTRIGLHIADAAIRNKEIKEQIKELKLDESNSPVDDFINSIIESSEIISPLEELLIGLLGLNVLMFIQIFILLFIVFKKLFSEYSLSILNINNLKIPAKLKIIINKINNFTDKYFFVLFIIISLSFIINLFISIYVCTDIYYNLKDYIEVYNYINGIGFDKSNFIEGVIGFQNTQKLLNNDNNKTLKQKYKNKYKFDKTNIERVSKYINNLKGDSKKEFLNKDKNIKFIDLIESKINESNFMPGYILSKSFSGILSIDSSYQEYKEDIKDDNNIENLDIEYGISNMIEYQKGFIQLLDTLEIDKIYKIIFRWKTVNSNQSGRNRVEFNTTPSFLISKYSDVDVLLYKFMSQFNDFEIKYGFSGEIHLDIFVKEWINESEFNLFQEIFQKIIDMEQKVKKSLVNKSKGKKMCINTFEENDNIFEKSFFDSDIDKLRKRSLSIYVPGVNYGCLINKEEIINKNYEDIFNLDLDRDKLYIFSRNNKNYICKVTSLYGNDMNLRNFSAQGPSAQNKNKVCIYLEPKIYDGKIKSVITELEQWVDIIRIESENIIVLRNCYNKGHSIEFVNNKIINMEIHYNSKKLVEGLRDIEHNTNIGVIDIETYKKSMPQGENEAIPYAIGFKSEFYDELFYLDSYSSHDEMVLAAIDSMLVPDHHNFKFYAHNMSGFDGIIILKSLMKLANKYNLKFNIYSDNDGNIISLDIVKSLKNKKIIKITILDSYLLLPSSLKKLGSLFNCPLSKGVFPYNFVNENNINYKNTIPEDIYFTDISIEELNNYKSQLNGIWDCKNETLKYLSKDLDVLYDIMIKFSENIFRDYHVNITRIRTISGLAFLIYNANYYKSEEKPIFFSKGKLEEFIRGGYYGGIVDIVSNYTDYETYKYDVNSHYPNAMLMPMPGGTPKISFEKDLDKLFGFVEAKVQAPTEKELKIPILPVKINGKTELFRNTVVGIWWSEELKMSRNYGYKILEVKNCIQFQKTENLFNDYVQDIYKKKLDADLNRNGIKRLINKLLLNSLYGRLGIKGQNINLKIVKEKNINKVLLTEKSDVLYQNNDLYLVKSVGPLDPEILNIVNKEKLYEDTDKDFNSKNPWSGISSSPQFSAAITAYARMNLNQFKNIPGNDYLGGDTDSIILTYPLDPKYVGSSLGQFKLEHIIKEGFYLSKKFYMFVTNDNEIIIKCKGINNKNNILNYDSFVELFKGNSITVNQIQFHKNYKTLELIISTIKKEIKGLVNKEINYKLNNRKIVLRE